jgi:RNA polymerase sigma-70 factor (ECF subfamily)
MKQAARNRRHAAAPRTAVARLPFFDSDAAIVAAVRAGQGAGGAALYDHHQGHVRRVLLRVLGPDADLCDLIQDVFLTAIASIEKLEDPDALRSWLAGISVHRAKREIHRRSRSRLFTLFSGNDPPEQKAPVATPEVDEAVRATYHILERLPANERVPFALRVVGGAELVEVADACNVSLATVKRRLARAKKKFWTMAKTYPELADWVLEAAP